MVPDNYHSPEGHQTERRAVTVQDLNNIFSEIRTMRQEIKDQIKGLETKVENIRTDHNQLELKMALVEERQKNTDAIINTVQNTLQRNIGEISNIKNNVENHLVEAKTAGDIKKKGADWVRWVPSVLFGLLAAIVTIINMMRQ